WDGRDGRDGLSPALSGWASVRRALMTRSRLPPGLRSNSTQTPALRRLGARRRSLLARVLGFLGQSLDFTASSPADFFRQSSKALALPSNPPGWSPRSFRKGATRGEPSRAISFASLVFSRYASRNAPRRHPRAFSAAVAQSAKSAMRGSLSIL